VGIKPILLNESEKSPFKAEIILKVKEFEDFNDAMEFVSSSVNILDLCGGKIYDKYGTLIYILS